MENKTSLQRFKELYGFREGIIDYIPQAGELLKYIGDHVILLIYKRNDKGEWSISNCIVKIDYMKDYDPMTGTYELRYDTEKPGTDSAEPVYDSGVRSLRVLPQGFSFENPEETGRSLRFIPFSYHYKFAEFQDFYVKLKAGYDSYKTMDIESLKQISESKDQRLILEPMYVCSVIKMNDDEILQFRITSLKLKHRSGKNYAITIGNEQGKTYTFMISSDTTEYEFSYGNEKIGDMKIVDLSTISQQEEESKEKEK